MFTKGFILSSALLSFLIGTQPSLADQSGALGQAVSEALYSFESDESGFNTKTYFYDNGEQVIVFDSQFTEAIAQDFLRYIQSVTQNPITHVILTHPNPDKFNGLSVFKKLGAKVIASEKTAEAMPEVHAYKKYYFVNIAGMFTDETYPKLESVDQTFNAEFDLTLQNGEVINLQEFAKPGVSGNQTVAYIPKANSLVVGDLVHSKAHAWLEGGIVNGQPSPTLEKWIEILSDLKGMYEELNPLVLGGRGENSRLLVSIPEQISYLQSADSLVSAYILSVSDRSELQGEQAQKHYSEIQLQFERKFPDYKLPYMIGYGIYGLVNSKL